GRLGMAGTYTGDLAGSTDFNSASSASDGRVISIEKLRRKAITSGAVSLRSLTGGSRHVTGMAPPPRLFAPSRDYIGLVDEPQPAVLLQDFGGGFEIAPVGRGLGHPMVLDLRHVDRGIPGGKQRRS